MADEVAKTWKWYVAASPQIGWDMAFQGPVDLLANLEKYNTIPVRRISKLVINKNKDTGAPVLSLDKYMPANFGAADAETDGVLDRKLFTWIQNVTPAAVEDWDKHWTEPVVSQSSVLLATENDARSIEEEAAARAAMANGLRRGPQRMK